MGSNEALLAAVEAEIASPMPTPPVGTMVIWYDRADTRPGGERAAVVTKIEEPGKLTLTIFPPNSMPIHKQGCLHISNPIHERKSNAVSRNSGAWDYLDFTDIPKVHYEPHLKRLGKKRDSIKANMDASGGDSTKSRSSTQTKRQTASAES
jgi:hypothetical protein